MCESNESKADRTTLALALAELGKRGTAIGRTELFIVWHKAGAATYDIKSPTGETLQSLTPEEYREFSRKNQVFKIEVVDPAAEDRCTQYQMEAV